MYLCNNKVFYNYCIISTSCSFLYVGMACVEGPLFVCATSCPAASSLQNHGGNLAAIICPHKSKEQASAFPEVQDEAG